MDRRDNRLGVGDPDLCSRLMARSRPRVAVSADWGGVSADISGAVGSGRVDHGSGETNPDRSTVETARGTLVLEGEDYQPGGSSRWTEAQLSTRAAIRVTLDTVTLWEGWVDQPRAVPRAGRPQTRYRLSGKLDEYATRQVDVSSASANLYTDSTLWAEVTGAAPRLTGAAGAGITFAPFMFEGRGFEVASLAALVGGRLAGEDRLGRLTMPTYGRLPPAADQKTVSSAALLIQNVETDKRVEQVRNRLRIPFDVAPASETVGADAQGSWDGVGETADSQTGRGRYQHTGVETLPTVTFRQPAPTAPTTFGRMSVSVAKVEIEVAATQLVVGNDPFTYHWRYAWVTIPSSLISASGSQSNINGRETLAVTMRAVSASDAISWTLAITNSRGQMSTQNWDYDDLDDLPFYRSALTPGHSHGPGRRPNPSPSGAPLRSPSPGDSPGVVDGHHSPNCRAGRGQYPVPRTMGHPSGGVAGVGYWVGQHRAYPGRPRRFGRASHISRCDPPALAGNLC
ncbi:hypothetical protein [Candidatus Poriferisocius sp.]|uniref:hypothetical protein n=1 Tax=Candidatus Poriferisocius sp. TaxID=3101276 RepID=UPI003B024F3F